MFVEVCKGLPSSADVCSGLMRSSDVCCGLLKSPEVAFTLMTAVVYVTAPGDEYLVATSQPCTRAPAPSPAAGV